MPSQYAESGGIHVPAHEWRSRGRQHHQEVQNLKAELCNRFRSLRSESTMILMSASICSVMRNTNPVLSEINRQIKVKKTRGAPFGMVVCAPEMSLALLTRAAALAACAPRLEPRPRWRGRPGPPSLVSVFHHRQSVNEGCEEAGLQSRRNNQQRPAVAPLWNFSRAKRESASLTGLSWQRWTLSLAASRIDS